MGFWNVHKSCDYAGVFGSGMPNSPQNLPRKRGHLACDLVLDCMLGPLECPQKVVIMLVHLVLACPVPPIFFEVKVTHNDLEVLKRKL